MRLLPNASLARITFVNEKAKKMQYKVVIVTEKSSCGGQSNIAVEIERETNRWSNSGYVLVTAYQQQVAVCCNQSAIGAVLIFAKHD